MLTVIFPSAQHDDALAAVKLCWLVSGYHRMTSCWQL